MSRVTYSDVVDMQEVYQSECKHEKIIYELVDDKKNKVYEKIICSLCKKDLVNTYVLTSKKYNKGE